MIQQAVSDGSFPVFVLPNKHLYEIKRFQWHADLDEILRTYDV